MASASQLMSVAAGEVADGERIAIAAIGEHELTLVVRTPQIITPAAWIAQRRVPCDGSAGDLEDHMAIEHCMNRADRWRLDVFVESTQLLADLGGAPTGDARAADARSAPCSMIAG